MAISKCTEPNCTSRARETKTGKCRKHGGGPRCTEPDCKTSAWDDGSGKCKKHGGGNCTEEGCKNKTRGKSGKCLDHGGGKCKEPGCTNSGSADKTGKCTKHGGGKCTEEGCTNNWKDSSRKCRKHGGGKCKEEGCKSNARDKTGKCRKHGGGKCSVSGCKQNCIGGQHKKCRAHGGGPRCPSCVVFCGSSDYDGYCANCFKHTFPNDPRSNKVHEHSKELRVRNAINETFEGFIHDKPLFTGECNCTHRRRIDHRKLIGATLLCVETDEFAHRDYDQNDEEIRYDDLYMVHSGKWIFIRFNPDGKGVHINEKLKQLLAEIEKQVERIERDENVELLEIVKMFY